MNIFEKIKNHTYNFEIKHFIILFAVVLIFQVVVGFLNKYSTNELLNQARQIYKKDAAERVANLTTNSFELLLEQNLLDSNNDEKNQIIRAFNILFSQQLLQNNIQEICIIISFGDVIRAIDNGKDMYRYFIKGENLTGEYKFAEFSRHKFKKIVKQIKNDERIFSYVERENAFHVFVPFVPSGELEGIVYLEMTPSLQSLNKAISFSYREINAIFTILILFALLAMLYITTYTIEDRDIAREKLFKMREEKIKDQVASEKEALFTKRVHHAHHKSEKIMGFIKEEISSLSKDNIEKFKYITSKYASFVSRVFYNMKWHDSPIHASRGVLFRSNVNEVLRFLVKNVFQRTSSQVQNYSFNYELDEEVPDVSVNEYVMWEVFEPLINNSIDHNREQEITITIRTEYLPEQGQIKIIIKDNGQGIDEDLFETNPDGVKKLFLENQSAKDEEKSGYGCYIAYYIAKKKCGWDIDAENLEKGCRFIISIPYRRS